MFHQWTIVGNVGRDPEVKYTATGQMVANFSVAVNDSYVKANGEKVERVTWYRITAWGRLAEIVGEFVNKGSRVLVLGKPITGEHGSPVIWKTTDGEPRANYDVSVSYLKLLGGTRSESRDAEPSLFPMDDESDLAEDY